MSSNQITQNELIQAFAVIDQLQADSEKLLKSYSALELDPYKYINKMIMCASPGAMNAANQTMENYKQQWAVMEKVIFPVMYKDVRNKPIFDACLDELSPKRSPSPAMFVRAAAKLINALKDMTNGI